MQEIFNFFTTFVKNNALYVLNTLKRFEKKALFAIIILG